MAQPNLAVIADSLHTLSDQVALVPNMPGLGTLQQHVANLDQRVGALDRCVVALDRQITNNHGVLLETINTNQRLILEQMQNNHRNLSCQIKQLQDEFVIVHLTEGITNNRPGTICNRLGCITSA